MNIITKYIILGFILTGFISASGQKLTMDEVVLKGRTTLSPSSIRGMNWIPGTSDLIWLTAPVQEEYMLKYNLSQRKVDTVVSLSELNTEHQRLGVDSLKSLPSFQWTDSVHAHYLFKNHLLEFQLTDKSVKEKNHFTATGLNPDWETKYFSVAYTQKNNLYVANRGVQIQITQDPDTGIVNGQAVHRNEFGIKKGTFWSPAGNYLAFYRMDESAVTSYPLVDLEETPAKEESIRYPMAGQTSHKVTLGIYDILKQKTLFLETGEPEDQYLTQITWAPDEKTIWVTILNRDQQQLKLRQYAVQTGKLINTWIEETSDKFVEPERPLIFLKSAPEQFIWFSKKEGFERPYLYDIRGKEIRILGDQSGDMEEWIGFSEDDKYVYYTVATRNGLDRQLCKVEISTGKIQYLTESEGIHTSKVNLSSGYFIDYYSALQTPREIRLANAEGKTDSIWLKASHPLVKFDTCKVELFTLYASDSTQLNGRLIYPYGFDPQKRYPVLIYVYGGPHAQLVTNNWLGNADLWLYSLAQKGYLVWTLDNRGSSSRGVAFEQATFRHFGKAEAEDQAVGISFLRNQPWVDTTRLDVYGWSFGGFMTLKLLSEYPQWFRRGVAGGAVCDWKLYEVMYTERYMDTPQQNPEGYAESDMTKKVGKIKADVLLIHGTSDDVVVWQHSLRMLKAGVTYRKIFDYLVYPGHGHNVSGRDRIHLYEAINRYLLR